MIRLKCDHIKRLITLTSDYIKRNLCVIRNFKATTSKITISMEKGFCFYFPDPHLRLRATCARIETVVPRIGAKEEEENPELN